MMDTNAQIAIPEILFMDEQLKWSSISEMIIQIDLLVFLVITVGVSQNGLDTVCRMWHLFPFCLEFSITTTTGNVTLTPIRCGGLET